MCWFVDTSVLLGFVRNDERHRGRAVATIRTVPPRGLITSDYVIDETLTRLRTCIGHAAAASLGRMAFGEGLARVEHVTTQDLGAARPRIFNDSDHDLSFTDCTVLAPIERLDILAVFTFDGDFRKVGCRVVRG